jgi:hypothetical protein
MQLSHVSKKLINKPTAQAGYGFTIKIRPFDNLQNQSKFWNYYSTTTYGNEFTWKKYSEF